MRRLGIIIGSDSDLSQCYEGFKYLLEKINERKMNQNCWIDTASIHRNPLTVQGLLHQYANEPVDEKVDALIIGAGWANHLTGMADAFLRNVLRDNQIVVFGIAFEDKDKPINTEAAVLSIIRVPGTQVVFDNYIGADGFLRACQDAVEGKLPEIKLDPINKTAVRRDLLTAIHLADELKNKKGGK